MEKFLRTCRCGLGKKDVLINFIKFISLLLRRRSAFHIITSNVGFSLERNTSHNASLCSKLNFIRANKLLIHFPPLSVRHAVRPFILERVSELSRHYHHHRTCVRSRCSSYAINVIYTLFRRSFGCCLRFPGRIARNCFVIFACRVKENHIEGNTKIRVKSIETSFRIIALTQLELLG